MVYMENRRNATLQATGYVLVRVDDSRPQLVAIACVISKMCIPNLEFQLVNPTTQVALFSECRGSCSSLMNITWNVYQGLNGSLSTMQWTPFSQITQHENIWFFGRNTNNFTATNQLFLQNPTVRFWRFQVAFSFITETSSSALNFVVNQPPSNGSCSISPLQGTTSTLFTVTCPGWVDDDGVKDYALTGYTANAEEQTIIAFSSVADFTLRLPSPNGNQTQLNLVVTVRDTLDCVVSVNLSTVLVTVDVSSISQLVGELYNSTGALTSNPLIRLLSSGNQNTAAQLITSLSQYFNQIDQQSIDDTVFQGGVPFASISVSSLASATYPQTSTPMNASALAEFNRKQNLYAGVRDYLIASVVNLTIATPNSIRLQASSLSQLSQSTNQLTRASAVSPVK